MALHVELLHVELLLTSAIVPFPMTTPELPFHVMTKPGGPICNLDCHYCFYLEKERLYPGTADW